jgi:K+-transporting ATPase c subunit
MKPNPLPLLRALSRAVKADRNLPCNWHGPLIDLVDLLLSDPDPAVSIQAARVVIEMVAANRRLIHEETNKVRTPTT